MSFAKIYISIAFLFLFTFLFAAVVVALCFIFILFYMQNLVNSALAFACFSFMFVRIYLLPPLLVFTAVVCVSLWPHTHIRNTHTHSTHGTSGDLFTYFVCFHCICRSLRANITNINIVKHPHIHTYNTHTLILILLHRK